MMPRHLCHFAVVLSFLAAATAQSQTRPSEPPPVYQVEVVRQYPHDRTAYTQGLAIADGKLYEGTGQYGKSSLRLVDLPTGRVLQNRPLSPRYFGEGILVWGDQILQLTWKNGLGIVYDRKTFKTQGTFRYDGEGWGITHDGRQVVMSDGTSVLQFLDPKTLRVARRLRVTDRGRPIKDLNELEFVDGVILANIWGSGLVACISPEDGRVLAWLDLRRLGPDPSRRGEDEVLNGIAYDTDAHRLYVTGKHWPVMYEIRPIVPPGGWYARLGEQREAANGKAPSPVAPMPPE